MLTTPPPAPTPSQTTTASIELTSAGNEFISSHLNTDLQVQEEIIIEALFHAEVL